jgi:hypothetical protein
MGYSPSKRNEKHNSPKPLRSPFLFSRASTQQQPLRIARKGVLSFSKRRQASLLQPARHCLHAISSCIDLQRHEQVWVHIPHRRNRCDAIAPRMGRVFVVRRSGHRSWQLNVTLMLTYGHNSPYITHNKHWLHHQYRRVPHGRTNVELHLNHGESQQPPAP